MLSRNYLSYIQAQARYRRRLNANLNQCRRLRSSPHHRILVGPPDPVSNLRPVIYDDDGTQASSSVRRRGGRSNDKMDASAGSSSGEKRCGGGPKGKGRENVDGGEEGKKVHENVLRIMERTKTSPTHPYLLDEFDGDPLDYQWRIERSRLDAYNHAFWTDSNARFEEAKHAVLSSLPENASPEAKEAALSEFYARWLRQEQDRLKDYAGEWSRRNYNGIMLAARVAIQRFRSRIFGAGSSNGTSSMLPPHPSSRQNNSEKQD